MRQGFGKITKGLSILTVLCALFLAASADTAMSDDKKGMMEGKKGTMKEGTGMMEGGKTTMKEGTGMMEGGKTTMKEGTGMMEGGKTTMKEGTGMMQGEKEQMMKEKKETM